MGHAELFFLFMHRAVAIVPATIKDGADSG
jgi:hypothetical protein